MKEKADSSLDIIADGKANREFPIKYFPVEQTKVIMYDLKNEYDFANRQGYFLNEYHSADKSKLSQIYK